MQGRLVRIQSPPASPQVQMRQVSGVPPMPAHQAHLAPMGPAACQPGVVGSHQGYRLAPQPPPAVMRHAQQAVANVPVFGSPPFPPTPGPPQPPLVRSDSNSLVRKASKITELKFVEGEQVDYFSTTYNAWVPSTIVSVDDETGAIRLDRKRGVDIPMKDRKRLLRPAARPGPEHWQYVSTVLREGRIDAEAERLFGRYATPSTKRARPGLRDLTTQGLVNAAAEVDFLLGTTGSVVVFLENIKNNEPYCDIYTQREFANLFWELLWSMQNKHGQALSADVVVPCHQEDPKKKYRILKQLGSGTYGTVHLAQHLETGVVRALKQIQKEEELEASNGLHIEVDHLRNLDHPNIVKLYEHFEDADNFYLAMDFCSGGDLHNAVRAKRDASGGRVSGAFSEEWISCVMEQVLRAIAHVHCHGIVHLDLKGANIMLMPPMRTLPPSKLQQAKSDAPPKVAYHLLERPHVMVIDLGVAQIFRPGDFRNKRPMGTPLTMAPEIWRGEITPKADVFSLGTVMFELLTFRLPWALPADMVLAMNYWLKKPKAPWDLLRKFQRSQQVVTLCGHMLNQNRHERVSATECLGMEFFSGVSGLDSLHVACDRVPAVPDGLVQQMSKVPQRSVLHKSVALAIARAWPSNQLPTIRKVFQELDSSNTGRLNKQQLEVALSRMGVDPAQAKEAADAMDFSRDNTVHWTEFVASCIHLGNETMEGELKRIFDEADTDNDGLLKQSDIAALLAADHLRGSEGVRDMFVELRGRAEEDAKVDWTTFRRHFKSRGVEDLQPLADEDETDGQTGAASEEDTSFLGQARQAGAHVGAVFTALFAPETPVEREWQEARAKAAAQAKGAMCPQQQNAVREEHLKRLAEMGYNDRRRCEQALARHRNRLSASLLDDLNGLNQ
eukprot:TRINITY_DN18742_c0_g1_i2.p1 TRINITY_DN18742_c0_g1~~TRINITY_DN18742_c0_g1_i2.p1  ORF type:complete len:898 (+),score=248.06 TRINITY_DN18742_c0_g1_i2:102-2795(+)